MRIFRLKSSDYITIAFIAWLLLRILPSTPKWDWKTIGLYTLVCAILIVVVGSITWLLLKIFPSLKKLNWKTLAGLSVFFKLFDFHSTYLILNKTKDYSAELNILLKFLWKNLGLGLLEGLIVWFIITVPLVIYVFIKKFVDERCYFIPYFVVIAMLAAATSNYICYFLFVA